MYTKLTGLGMQMLAPHRSHISLIVSSKNPVILSIRNASLPMLEPR